MLSVAYAECRVLDSVMLSVIMLNVVRLSVVAPLFVQDEDIQAINFKLLP